MRNCVQGLLLLLGAPKVSDGRFTKPPPGSAVEAEGAGASVAAALAVVAGLAALSSGGIAPILAGIKPIREGSAGFAAGAAAACAGSEPATRRVAERGAASSPSIALRRAIFSAFSLRMRPSSSSVIKRRVDGPTTVDDRPDDRPHGCGRPTAGAGGRPQFLGLPWRVRKRDF